MQKFSLYKKGYLYIGRMCLLMATVFISVLGILFCLVVVVIEIVDQVDQGTVRNVPPTQYVPQVKPLKQG